jgi:hypothetical protein
MSTFVVEPPGGSRITAHEVNDSLCLSWHNRTGIPWPYYSIPCGGLLVLGFPFLFYFVIYPDIKSDEPWMLILGPLFWMICLVIVGSQFYGHFRGQNPESVTLDAEQFRYDSGETPLREFTMSPTVMLRHQSMLWESPELFVVDRRMCRNVVIEEGTFEGRLLLDAGKRQIRFADFLGDADKRWLANVLNDWIREGNAPARDIRDS